MRGFFIRYTGTLATRCALPLTNEPAITGAEPYSAGMTKPQFTLDGEHETPNGWLYTFTLERDGAHSDHELTLSWVDHEHLVGGAIAPELVAKAAFSLAVGIFSDEVPAKFDVSSVRRRVDGFDELLRERIEAPL